MQADTEVMAQFIRTFALRLRALPHHTRQVSYGLGTGKLFLANACRPCPTTIQVRYHAKAKSDWSGDAESRHAALLTALGEVELEGDESALGDWSTAVLPDTAVQLATDAAAGHGKLRGDWNGDAESRHAALLTALGEVELEGDESALGDWSTAVLPDTAVQLATDSAAGHGKLRGDWWGDAESRHAALLTALGEVELECDESALGDWSTAVLPDTAVQLTTDAAAGHGKLRGDWNGDAESRHAALLTALGEVELEGDESALGDWSTAVLPDTAVQLATDAAAGHGKLRGDWSGDAESRHAALLTALGEVELEGDESALGDWSTAVLPGTAVQLATDAAAGHGKLRGDWNGDAESRHAALLTALGEVELEGDESALGDWSTAVLPDTAVQLATDAAAGHGNLRGDWSGDAESRHAALLTALGEVELEGDESALGDWSTAVLPDTAVQLATDAAAGHGKLRGDWSGDAESRHAALLTALGEVELEGDESALGDWSTAVLPGTAVQLATDSAAGHGKLRGDWSGDAESRHAVLLTALGEVELEGDESALGDWSTAVLPGTAVQLATDAAAGHGKLRGDWSGDAESRHSALLTALGEVELEGDESALGDWSTAVLPDTAVQLATDAAAGHGKLRGDWSGDAESRHSALLTALGEVELEGDESALGNWSTAVLPDTAVQLATDAAAGHGKLRGDWWGDAESRHAALLTALGEVELEDD